MPTDELKLTPRQVRRAALKQLLRAALKVAIDALSVRFARRQAVSFTGAGQSIRGWFYHPRSDGKGPGLLLLPTAMGLTPHDHAFAARLARAGFTTLVIAYSERTTGAVINDDLRRRHLEQIVVAGWRLLQNNGTVDATRTAVIGLSLGGYFAIHLAAAVNEFPPKAVAIYYGMYALAGSDLMRLHAPLLLLQGEDDDTYFVTNAKRLQEVAVRGGRPWQAVSYPDTGHQFDLFEPGGAAARDAWERTVEFLRHHLEPTALNAANKAEAAPKDVGPDAGQICSTFPGPIR
jgi:dienelactone hydrolase